MLPGIEMMNCPNLAVPSDVMQHVVHVESAFNPYAIGVVGGRLVRQPRSLAEAVSTARMLDAKGFNFSVGLAQVNKHNFDRYGLDSYERAFDACANLQAGSRILQECYGRSGGNWGKSFSCYYSGNFTTGFRHGYVRKIYASMRGAGGDAPPIEVIAEPARSHAVAVPSRKVAESAQWQQRLVATQPSTAAVAPMATPTANVPSVSTPGPATPPSGPVVLHAAASTSAAPPAMALQASTSGTGDQAFVF